MRTFLLCLLASIMLSSCGNSFKKISSDYDRSADFSNYKTYAWLDKNVKHSETPYDNEIVENNIKNYVDNELEKRNYTASNDAPDLLFELVLSDKEKVSTSSVPVYSSPQYPYPVTSYRYYNPGNYRWNQHIYNNYSYVRPSYRIGTRIVKTPYNHAAITIHVFDRIKNRLVWTGTAKGDVYDDNYSKKDIHPAVIKILDQYPVKAMKK